MLDKSKFLMYNKENKTKRSMVSRVGVEPTLPPVFKWRLPALTDLDVSLLCLYCIIGWAICQALFWRSGRLILPEVLSHFLHLLIGEEGGFASHLRHVGEVVGQFLSGDVVIVHNQISFVVGFGRFPLPLCLYYSTDLSVCQEVF